MKKRLISIFSVLALMLVQIFNLMPIKAAESSFAVKIVVESNKGVIVSDTSNKTNAYEALIDVLKKHNINYDFPNTDYGPQLKTIKDVTMAADWSTYWYYYGKRDNKYFSMDVINTVTLQNNDTVVVAFQNAATKLVNNISYSTEKAGKPITITFESKDSFNPKAEAEPVKNFKVKLYEYGNETNVLFDKVISDNKITFNEGLKAGQYVLSISDFKSKAEEFPSIIADSFVFKLTSSEETTGGNTQTPPSTNPYERDNTKIAKTLESDLKAAADYIKANNKGDAWAELSLKKLGMDTDVAFIKKSAVEVKKNSGVQDFTNTELEKLILVLTANGYKADSFMGYNLVAELFNRDINSFLINDAVYGLIVYNYANLSGDYKISKEQLVNFLLKNKLTYKENNIEMSGWALSGDKLNPDITGLTISSLAPFYRSNAEVKAAVDVSVKSLSALQNESGYIADNFGYFSESLDMVIIGLTSVGIDPEGAEFTKSKGDLVSALLSFKGTNGQFKHSLEENNDYIATEQALRALIALKESKVKGSYNYYSGNIDSSKLKEFEMTETELLANGYLPQTGAALDFTVLSAAGLVFIGLGLIILKRKSSTLK